MEKWEYLTVELEKGTFWKADHLTRQQNEYGKKGWELVSQFITLTTSGNSVDGNRLFATFKRKA